MIHGRRKPISTIRWVISNAHTEYVPSTPEEIVTFDPLMLPQVASPGPLAPWRRLISLNGLAHSGQWDYGIKHEDITCGFSAGVFSNVNTTYLIRRYLASQFPRSIPSLDSGLSNYTLTFFEPVDNYYVPSKAKSQWRTGLFFCDSPESARHLRLSTLSAIGFLTEIDNVLSDNIKQWGLYYQGRVEPLLDDRDIIHRLDAACLYPPAVWETFRGGDILKQLKKIIQQVQTHVITLNELRNDFNRKLETTKALRDGLFNASALVESRAFTRLGENVKLLTYVSIFYLPLALCAALWAIPNIQGSSTKVPFIITAFIVGAITYAIVLKMDFISQNIDANHNPRRQKLVDHMQKDNSEWWQETGKRFEVFKPTSESKVPTEWWIPIYLIRKVFRRGSCTKKASREAENNSFA
ncbi:hypothetical protein BPAE_0077g00410 [Botrytis paeoniae]|uniref:Uncharacterized protein n=1 Tax=Botrytis paeoniae TaxID=278948 RepID=A0A4Z1FRJ1_9HELO|nr:hypothetical protein BPAE_0077g00410 [Botrytis paeoniae]